MPQPTHDGDFNLFLAIGRLEGKVDVLILSRDGHEKRLDVLEKELTSVRISRAKLIGMAMAASAGFSALGFILNLLLHK